MERYKGRKAGGVADPSPPFVPQTLTLYNLGLLEKVVMDMA
jgi:hypothetical protein